MPPKGHSSSSHSSSSRSSFSGSRSRSSFSSSRSYSSSSSRSYRSGPSSHSSSSHSSSPSFQRPVTIPNRPRKNQPSGFMPGNAIRPAYHYARRHDYIFYPVAWVDQQTGTSYEAGYYDEDGTRYDSVAFKKGDSYDNVVCHCPYCEQNTILNLTSEQIASHSLQCPHCGGQMQIQSALDEYTDSEGSSGVASPDSETTQEKKKNKTLRWVIAALAIMLSVNMCTANEKEKPPVPDNNGITVVQNNPSNSNTDLFGSVINLVQREGSAYGLLGSDSVAFDKTLIWDAENESYYDSSSDCWIWYNTDMTPSVWQYWYEGISSDYDDSGWMEFDEAEKAWYIEASDGNWIKLPERYDSSCLWHIEN